VLLTCILTSLKFFVPVGFYLKVKYVNMNKGKGKGKGKGHPRTGHEGPEGE